MSPSSPPALHLQQNSLPGTMSTVVAQSLHVFGFRSHVANNVFFFDEQIIIFPSGNHCVKYNVDQKWQKFIPGKTLSSLTYVTMCARYNPIIPSRRLRGNLFDQLGIYLWFYKCERNMGLRALFDV